MSYKSKIGNLLKEARKSKNYTILNVMQMTGLKRSTVINVEKGTAAYFDLYVEYAKAVGCSIPSSEELGIELVPKYPLTVNRLDRSNITRVIRGLLDGDYFKKKRKVGEVRNHLISKDLISSTVTSARVSSILRNILKDGVLKIDKSDSSHLYYKD